MSPPSSRRYRALRDGGLYSFRGGGGSAPAPDAMPWGADLSASLQGIKAQPGMAAIRRAGNCSALRKNHNLHLATGLRPAGATWSAAPIEAVLGRSAGEAKVGLSAA